MAGRFKLLDVYNDYSTAPVSGEWEFGSLDKAKKCATEIDTGYKKRIRDTGRTPPRLVWFSREVTQSTNDAGVKNSWNGFHEWGKGRGRELVYRIIEMHDMRTKTAREMVRKAKGNPMQKKTARKKKRSPAQRANDKRLGAMAKKRAAKGRERKKKTVKKRATNPPGPKRGYLIVASRNGDRIEYLTGWPTKWGRWTDALRFTSDRTAKFAARESGRKSVVALDTVRETELGKVLRGK